MLTYDKIKRAANLKKHRIDLATVSPVFDAPMVTREDTRASYGEHRFSSLGWLSGDVVVLVWTERTAGAHVISCRRAKRYERETYFRIYPPSV